MYRHYRIIILLLLSPIFAVLLMETADAFSALDSSSIIFHFHGPDTTSRVGRNITKLGDVNGDGFDDIAINCRNPAGTFLFYGGTPPDSFPDLLLKGSGGSINPIDISGDGISEFFTVESSVLYLFRGYEDSIATTPYDSLMPNAEFHGFSIFAKTGYVDEDSLGDFLTLIRGVPGPQEIYYFSGATLLSNIPDWTFYIDNFEHIITAYELIDFNGDNKLDICINLQADQDTSGYVYIFLGENFGSEPDILIGQPIELELNHPRDFAHSLFGVGDFDGDGWDDLSVIYIRGAPRHLIYKCGPQADTLFDYRLDNAADWIAGAGDVNGDGYDDIICGGSGRYRGAVFIYLGGIEADSIFDMSIGRYDLPPLFLDDIGWRTSSAGDFNGDGIDDFMFSCQNFAHGEPGDVFVFSGSEEIITDIENDSPSFLPEKMELMQNHPNPFNASTSIEFTISARSCVTITIYNLHGQEVRTIIEKTLPAGKHIVFWDGKNSDDQEAASGVYLYQINAGESVEAKKMILLK
jgi:hypothetical protein